MKTLSRKSFFAITLMAVCSTTALASGSQGTLTASFFNDCIGNRDIGINAVMYLIEDETDGGKNAEFNMNVPEKYNDPGKILWLKCGERVSKTLNYDFPGEDYEFQSFNVRSYYVEGGTTKQVFGWKRYGWKSADGTSCTVTYTGSNPPAANINCQQ